MGGITPALHQHTGDYYAALAAWEARCTELAARGLDYYADDADDAWWEACEAEPRQ